MFEKQNQILAAILHRDRDRFSSQENCQEKERGVTWTPVVRTVLWWRMVLPMPRLLRLLFWMPGLTPNRGLRQPGRDCRRAD